MRGEKQQEGQTMYIDNNGDVVFDNTTPDPDIINKLQLLINRVVVRITNSSPVVYPKHVPPAGVYNAEYRSDTQ